MTTTLPPSLAAPASLQNGVFTTAQAHDAGMDRHEVAGLARRKVWHRIRRGAYVEQWRWDAADANEREVLHVQAVVLGLRAKHVVSHLSSAAVQGLRRHGVPSEQVHVTHDRGAGSSRHEADVVHHEAGVPAAHRTTCRGVVVTDAAWTAVELTRVLPLEPAVVLADGVLAGGVTPQQLRALHEMQIDWPGSRAAGRAIHLADGRSESVGETLGRLAFHGVGLPPDALQHVVLTDRGRTRADYAWLEWGVVGEFDGRIKYGRLLRPGESTQDVLVRERQRELALERAGWTVVRFVWSELYDAELVRARLLQARSRAQRVHPVA